VRLSNIKGGGNSPFLGDIMLIIDKNSDYYDHYSHIYGVDKKVVFDRRGSVAIFDENLYNNPRSIRYFRPYEFFLLEIGYKQILFKFNVIKTRYDNILFREVASDYEVSIVKTFEDNKHYFTKEISLVTADIPWEYTIEGKSKKKKMTQDIKFNEISYNIDRLISLPILKNTSLPVLLNGDMVWKELSNYVSSKNNDKDISIINSDKDKIVNHGFDVVTSFRNPIKL
jgi:hypothetical protein